jgi:dipeptidyl aminopeptidase/acylaminoacyl peptidase
VDVHDAGMFDGPNPQPERPVLEPDCSRECGDGRPLRRGSRLPGVALALLLGAGSLLCAQQNGPVPPEVGEPDPVVTPRRFAALDVFDLEYADEPAVASDGSLVVFTRRSLDVMRDRTRSSLWALTEKGIRPFVVPEDPEVDAHHAVFAPRGTPKRVAYLSNLGGRGVQIRVRWLEGSRADVAVTSVEHAPADLCWSPDGRMLAFTMFVPRARAPFVSMPRRPEGAAWAESPTVVEELRWRADGAGELEPGARHVFVVPADGGTATRLTPLAPEADHRGPLAWIEDGGRIVCSANRREDRDLEPVDTDLWAVACDGSERMQRLTDRFGPDEGVQVSPDGTSLCWIGFDDERLGYQVRSLYVAEVAAIGEGSLSKAARCVSSTLERSVRSPRFTEDRIVFLYDDAGRTKIGAVQLGEKPTLQRGLADDVGGTTLGRPYASGAFAPAPDGRIFYTHGSFARPADLYELRADGRGQTRRTDLNAELLGRRSLARVEEFFVDGPDDERVQAWLALPPDVDPADARELPTILEIHGGPFANYGPRFSAEFQLYAAAGYAVLFVNPRGSTSYGPRFANLIHHDYPSDGDYGDLMAAVDAVVARGVADPERLFVTGGSGGGVLTAWIVGRTDRFRAAVVAKPVIHWASFVLTADAYPYFTKYWFDRPPWEIPEAYWRRSPLSLVGTVRTPTMLLTGQQDYRTPVSESEQYYQALKLRGVETALVRFPDAAHGIAGRPSRLIAKVRHVLAWFARYGGPPVPDGG